MKLFAAVASDGTFEFESIRRKLTDVVVSRSDAVHRGVTASAVGMFVVKDKLPESVEQAQDDLWEKDQIAWVWQNFDGSFWMDTLSLTRSETSGWSNNVEKTESLGSKIVLVKFICHERVSA